MRFAPVLAAAFVIAPLGPMPFASAADYLHPYHRSHHYRSGGAYASDRACPEFEPADYRPKTTNFHEPLCYAARPYGLSTHLYDISPDLQGYD